MSLLLQALQKAAKNRDDSTGTASVSGNDDDKLTLEPLAEPQLKESASREGEIQPEKSTSPDDAAGVMRANELPGYSVLDWARDHYMLTFLVGAALFAILYGLYVYVQISSPGLFQPAPTPASAPIQTTMAPAPAPANDLPRISGLPEVASAAEPHDEHEAAMTADKSDTAAPQVSGPTTTGRAETTPAAVAATTKPSPRVRRTTVSPEQSATARPASSRGVSTKLDNEGVEVVEIPLGPSVVAIPDDADTPDRRNIAVQAEYPAYSKIDPVLMMAYEALQHGDYEKATVLYSEVLSRMPESTDAMLGLAAIAWKQGRPNVASQYYGRVLEVDPRNTHAQAGLIGILGNADPVAAETRLKQLISREPSGFLYFTLGNLYAQRSLWSQAQQAYFQAFQFQPDNSDYAFNLAVGLEHLGQTRPALEYYRKALDLSFKNGRANFDQKLAIERVGQLSARVD